MNKLSSATKVVFIIVPFLIILAIWQFITAMGWILPLFLPSPSHVMQTFLELLREGVIWENVGVSTMRLLKGWLLGMTVSVLLGWLLGLVPMMRHAIQPMIFPMRFIEPVAWISIVILWFGTGEMSKTLLLAYSAFFGSFLQILASVISIDKNRIHSAQSMGANRWQVFTTCVIPTTIPSILTGARVGMGYAFLTIITAEMLDGKSGLGYIIGRGNTYMLLDQMLVGTILVGIMGILIDFLFRQCVRLMGRRFFLNQH